MGSEESLAYAEVASTNVCRVPHSRWSASDGAVWVGAPLHFRVSNLDGVDDDLSWARRRTSPRRHSHRGHASARLDLDLDRSIDELRGDLDDLELVSRGSSAGEMRSTLEAMKHRISAVEEDLGLSPRARRRALAF